MEVQRRAEKPEEVCRNPRVLRRRSRDRCNSPKHTGRSESLLDKPLWLRSSVLVNYSRGDHRSRTRTRRNSEFARDYIQVTGGFVNGVGSDGILNGIRHIREFARRIHAYRNGIGLCGVRRVCELGQSASGEIDAESRDRTDGLGRINELA